MTSYHHDYLVVIMTSYHHDYLVVIMTSYHHDYLVVIMTTFMAVEGHVHGSGRHADTDITSLLLVLIIVTVKELQRAIRNIILCRGWNKFSVYRYKLN